MRRLHLIAVTLLFLSCSPKEENNPNPPAPDPPKPPTPEQTYYATVWADKTYGRETEYFFMDLKGKPDALTDEAVARILFETDGMNGVRIPIYGNAVNGGHTAAGEVDTTTRQTVYKKVIKSLNNAKKYYKGTAPFTVMASKKLDGGNGTSSFPTWVMDADGVNSERYARMLMDYLVYMNDNGVTIDVLGIDNEMNFNEGNITPQRYKEIVDIVRRETVSKGLKTPLMIGPERYNPQRDMSESWIKELFDKGWGDRMDIYGTHYYPRHHSQDFFTALKTEYSIANSDRARQFWATEPHWDNDTAAQSDMLLHAEQAIGAIWDQTDVGLSAMMWWGYKWDGSLRGCLMHALSLAVYGAQPVQISDHDGDDILTNGKLQTRAFRKGNEITIFMLNICAKSKISSLGKSYAKYNIKIDDKEVDGTVDCLQWSDSAPDEGNAVTPTTLDSKTFTVSLPARSITRIRFNVK